jgi:hypothetical protein
MCNCSVESEAGTEYLTSRRANLKCEQDARTTYDKFAKTGCS